MLIICSPGAREVAGYCKVLDCCKVLGSILNNLYSPGAREVAGYCQVLECCALVGHCKVLVYCKVSGFHN